MDELKKLVKELEALDNKEDIVAKLQEIGKKLLTEYVIKVGDLVIEPLLVEAYYYNRQVFPDCNTYGACDLECRAKQQQFNRLFVHPPKHSAGIDICLSSGEHCLSFLIKNSKIYNNDSVLSDFCTQEKLASTLIDYFGSVENIESKTNVLAHKSAFAFLSTSDSELITAKRKGTSKGDYSNSELAMLLLDKIRDYNYSLEKNYSRSALIKKYIENHRDKKSEDLYDLAKGFISAKEVDSILKAE